MIGYTNASSGVAYGEYEDQVELMTRADVVTFPHGYDNWSCQDYKCECTTSISSGQGFVSADWSIFLPKVNYLPDQYIFSYNGTNWLLLGNVVTLSEYGLEIVSGSPVSGDEIFAQVDRSGPFEQTISLSRIESTNTPVTSINIPDLLPGYIRNTIANGDVSINWTTFAAKVVNQNSVYTFVYNNSQWQLEGTTIAVNLAEYGITIVSGIPVLGNTITVHYSIREYLDSYGYITKIETISEDHTHKHTINIQNANPIANINLEILNSSQTTLDGNGVVSWLQSKDYCINNRKYCPVTGTIGSSTAKYISLTGNGISPTGEAKIFTDSAHLVGETIELVGPGGATVADTVIEYPQHIGQLKATCYTDEPLMDIQVVVKGV